MPSNNKIPSWALRQRQSLPLDAKIKLSELRIRQWYEHWQGQVHVSFSGGKDSTVLLDIVRSLYPDVPAVFIDTGLEFPENREFVRTIDNVVWLKPKMNFKRVLEKYGFPVISKENAQKIYEIRTTKSDKLRSIRLGNNRRALPKKWRFMVKAPFKISSSCCDVLKKEPFKRYEKETGSKALVGTMAADSGLRKVKYLSHGCNAFDMTRPRSAPLSVWLERDVWGYLKSRALPYSSIYDKGYTRTGCMFCAFGVHLEKDPNRFQRMKRTHPKLWAYCMDKLGAAGGT